MKQGCSKGQTWAFAVLAAAMSLTACSSEEPAAQPPQPTTSEASAVQVPNPKDATAVDPCNMLPEQTRVELGLEPEGRKTDEGTGCDWYTEDLSKIVTLTVLSNRSLQEFRNSKEAYVDYEEFTVDGHPAIRANQGEPAKYGFCDFFLATNTNQILVASGRDSSQTDACGPARKALEAAVPNLPAAN